MSKLILEKVSNGFIVTNDEGVQTVFYNADLNRCGLFLASLKKDETKPTVQPFHQTQQSA